MFTQSLPKTGKGLIMSQGKYDKSVLSSVIVRGVITALGRAAQSPAELGGGALGITPTWVQHLHPPTVTFSMTDGSPANSEELKQSLQNLPSS